MTRNEPPRVVVLGLGDTGVLIAPRLARFAEVTGVTTRLALVSGQELGTRLSDPATWRRTYFVPFRRFRRLDRVRLVHARATAVDLVAHTVEVEGIDGGTETLSYDYLVIATGATNGFWRHDRLEHLDEIERDLERVRSRVARARHLGVVGGGPTGVNLASQLARAGHPVDLFYATATLLPEYHPRVQRFVTEQLDRDGVRRHPGHRAVAPTGGTREPTSGPLTFAGGPDPFDVDLVLWAVGDVRPHSGFLPGDVLSADGFVLVDEHLRVRGQRDVFAVGDVAQSDPRRSSARNWGWRVVVANVRRVHAGRRRLRRFRAPRYRWGSVLGPRDGSLTVVQPSGRHYRVPRVLAGPLLYDLFVTRYLYGGLRPPNEPEGRR